jgi:hypothetical protein
MNPQIVAGKHHGRGPMAVNKPTGDNARKGAIKKRSQTKTTLAGASAWTNRNRSSGEFMALKRPSKKMAAKKFKGVRTEKERDKTRRRQKHREEKDRAAIGNRDALREVGIQQPSWDMT